MFQSNRNVGSVSRSGTGYRSRDWSWPRSVSVSRSRSVSRDWSKSWMSVTIGCSWYTSSANSRIRSRVGNVSSE